MYHLGLLAEQQTVYSTYTYMTLQGVLITSLCSLSGLSEIVSYSDYAAGFKIWLLDPSRDVRFFSPLKCPDRLWDKGYGDSSLGAQCPGHGVDHSFPFSGQG